MFKAIVLEDIIYYLMHPHCFVLVFMQLFVELCIYCFCSLFIYDYLLTKAELYFRCTVWKCFLLFRKNVTALFSRQTSFVYLSEKFVYGFICCSEK